MASCIRDRGQPGNARLDEHAPWRHSLVATHDGQRVEDPPTFQARLGPLFTDGAFQAQVLDWM
jgi:hypothetical protein